MTQAQGSGADMARGTDTKIPTMEVRRGDEMVCMYIEGLAHR
jgi:hypothetical protein